METLDGILFGNMIAAGAESLKAHADKVNDLNVFPIPDGDTGDNMLLTVSGGLLRDGCKELSEAARRAAHGMLLSARGNSGVILSQFFEGVARGFAGRSSADAEALGGAFDAGVKQAYAAVMTPTEGTVLTVMREAAAYAAAQGARDIEGFFDAFIEEGERSLLRTPELLPILKRAGVVDSGAAGLLYIVKGMRQALGGRVPSVLTKASAEGEINLDAFGENDVLTLGYCTELLLRLQSAKTDVAAFDIQVITDYLQAVGDSVAAVQSGSLIKLHVHTARPQAVLDFCQGYGEFLKVKIENMSLQHNDSVMAKEQQKAPRERRAFGAVAVASGEGLKETFLSLGADEVIDGGQSMNPSAEDFIKAFDRVNAEVIFVFPNNGNIILTAEQAARLYQGSDVRVIPSATLGAGYASLSMLDTTLPDADAIEAELCEAMEGVLTAEISRCVRDAVMDGKSLHTGDYIGFMGKTFLAAGKERLQTACETLDRAGCADCDICIIICGKGAEREEARRIEEYVKGRYSDKELYIIDGGQDVYDYILILE